jgi:EAL domain-containing protein (putative c-di-GMP-specific phosphodiesterase class I)
MGDFGLRIIKQDYFKMFKFQKLKVNKSFGAKAPRTGGFRG